MEKDRYLPACLFYATHEYVSKTIVVAYLAALQSALHRDYLVCGLKEILGQVPLSECNRRCPKDDIGAMPPLANTRV